MEKEIETFSGSESSGIMLSDDFHETKVGHGRFAESNEIVSETGSSKQSVDKGSKKKKGKSSGSMAASATESGLDNQENFPMKSKKNQRKGKDNSSLQVLDSKASVKREPVKTKEHNLKIPSEEWIMQKLTLLVPELADQGLLVLILVLSILLTRKLHVNFITDSDWSNEINFAGIDDSEAIVRPLANYIRPMLINYLKERRNALFTANAERMKRLIDNLQKKLDEVSALRLAFFMLHCVYIPTWIFFRWRLWVII